MKKSQLLNSEISYAISKIGHTQTLTIGDSGLPIEDDDKRIDLALIKGIPTFLQTLDAVLSEMCVERIILADEIKEANPKMEAEILKRFEGIPIDYMPHVDFKKVSKGSVATVRTGEDTPFSNIILVSGVTF